MPGLRARAKTDAALDAASALFVPVVLFLIPLNEIVIGNIRDLPYEPSLIRVFLYVGLAVWLIGVWVVRRFRARVPARLWIAVPWAVMLLDVLGAALEDREAPLAVKAVADALVVTAVTLVVLRVSWPGLRGFAAAAGVGLALQGLWVHVAFARELPPDAVLAGNRSPGSPAVPDPGEPGNVYHILLDAYQSESFAYSTGARAVTRYPGFTFYTRFNTMFPRTESSEPAMIEGRVPAGISIDDWPARALRDGFWRDLSRAGVEPWLYTYGRALCPDYAFKCVASSDLEREADTTISEGATIDLWAIRLMPASVRALLRSTADGEGSGFDRTVGFSVTRALGSAFGEENDGEGAASLTALPRQFFNLQQFDELLADEAQRPARGQYVYYHALIPHPEFIMNDRCEPIREPRYGSDRYWAFVACANLMIDRLVQRLRDLDRFDDALIIVHADHGDPQFLVAPEALSGNQSFGLDAGARVYQQPDVTYRDFEQFQSLDSATWRSIAVEVLSSGLLLVKAPHAHTYAEDAQPVELLDLAPTVLAHFGLDRRAYVGVPVSRVRAGRESVFYAHGRDFDGKLSKYRLQSDGWGFVEDVPVGR